MPEHLRALVVILVLASAIFSFAKRPLCAVAMTREDFVRRRNLWFTITLIAFLAHNFWVYIVAVGILVWRARAREHNPLALYFALLFAVPPISAVIGGAGIIEHFISIDYLRLLALVILLPMWWMLRRRADVPRFGTTTADKFLIAYLLLLFLLRFRGFTSTDSLRFGFYLFVDDFLPYYVASRALRNLEQVREAMVAFVLAAMVMALLGVFEMARYWLLYSPLAEALGVDWVYGAYLGRESTLRALASTGQPIVLGFVMVIALGFYYFLWRSIPDRWRMPGLLLLIAGLLSPLSRGPWIAAMVLPVVFALTGERPARKLALLGTVAGAVVALLLISAAGSTIIDYLPFVGNVDAENVTYRQRLIDNSLIVIAQNPLFGSFDVFYRPEMEELRQGEGIIDVVNAYIGIALSYGLVGVALFVGILLSALLAVWKTMSSLPGKDDDHYRLGQTLLAALVVIFILILTVSSILVIPIVNWTVAGLGIAYARMLTVANPAIRAVRQ